MKYLVSKLIFLLLEISMNIISLVILPKPNHFEGYGLSSPKKTSIAILVFGAFQCVFHFLKIIIYLNYICDSNCYNGDKDTVYGKMEYVNIPTLIINLGLAGSMIPKIENEITRSTHFLQKLKSRVIGVVVLYCLSFVFIIFQYFFMSIYYSCSECCGDSKKTFSGYSTYSRNYNNDNNNQNNYIVSRNNIINSNRKNNTLRSEVVQVRVTKTTNNIVLLSNILERRIYENLRTFIQQGKEKMFKLIQFYLEMRFIGLTTKESISNEIANIVLGVAKILSDVFDDKVARVCLELGSEDHIMLLMHYAFPYIIAVIKLKIERGIYRRSVNIMQTNLIQVLTQVERRIEQDEEGNIRVNFRVSRQINQASLIGLLNH